MIAGERQLNLPSRQKSMILLIGRPSSGRTTIAQLLSGNLHLMESFRVDTSLNKEPEIKYVRNSKLF